MSVSLKTKSQVTTTETDVYFFSLLHRQKLTTRVSPDGVFHFMSFIVLMTLDPPIDIQIQGRETAIS